MFTWFLLLWAIGATAALVYQVIFKDRGSRIYACPSEKAKGVVIQLLATVCHKKPQYRLDGQVVKRAMYSDGVIINHTAPEVHAKIGNAAAGLGIVTDDPELTARRAARFLKERGFQAEVKVDLEPDAPKGSCVFLYSPDALGNWVVVFRQHFLKLPRPPKWKG